MDRPLVLIVSPYAAAANNGNVRTAQRWASLIAPRYRAVVRTPEDTTDDGVDAALLIALHARRSHPAVRSWRQRTPDRPVVVVLTGTDLYHDVPLHDSAALSSLEIADRLVVLQGRGIDAMPERFRAKATAVYQSAPALPTYARSPKRLRVLFVGHLREEKDPFTFIRAAAHFRNRHDVEFALIGGIRDAALEAPTRDLLQAAPNVRMLGMQPHRVTRERIRRAHLLVVPSRMEGGANVVVEAITAGTPVLASDCDGNLGMLPHGYPGIFPVRDHDGLAHLVARCRTEPAFYDTLRRQCAAHARLFSPEAEQRALYGVIDALLEPPAI